MEYHDINSFEIVPDELIAHIASNLDMTTFKAFSLTCKRINKIIKDTNSCVENFKKNAIRLFLPNETYILGTYTYSYSSNNARWEWRKNGCLHSYMDQPIITNDGAKYWYYYGKLHRENNLPAIDCPINGKSWYKNGKELKNIKYHDSANKYLEN